MQIDLCAGDLRQRGEKSYREERRVTNPQCSPSQKSNIEHSNYVFLLEKTTFIDTFYSTFITKQESCTFSKIYFLLEFIYVFYNYQLYFIKRSKRSRVRKVEREDF